MAADVAEQVDCTCEFSFRGGEGQGRLTSLSRNGAEISDATAQPSEKLTLSLRIFETSTPIRLPSTLLSAKEKTFEAGFVDLQPALRNLLRIALRKLRDGGPSVRARSALMKDGS